MSLNVKKQLPISTPLLVKVYKSLTFGLVFLSFAFTNLLFAETVLPGTMANDIDSKTSSLTTQTSVLNKASQHSKRIIALAPNIVEILFELGVGEQIVGVSEHTDFPKAAQSLPTVANYLGIQLEAVVQSQPDVIIVWEGGTPERDIQKLKSIGFQVHTFSANSIDELLKQVSKLGHLVGEPEQAQRLVNKLRRQHEELQEAQAYWVKQSRVGFVEIWPAPLTTAGGTTIIGQAMKYCGLANIFENAGNTYPQVSLEKVLVAKPDVIIQPISKSNPTQTKDWTEFVMIPAVANQAIVSPNSDALFRWGPRLPSEIRKMCEEIQKVIKTK